MAGCKSTAHFSISFSTISCRIIQRKHAGVEADLVPMRPGRLAQQKRKDRNGKLYGSYWQLGYTYKMKSRSHYVSDNLLKTVREQTDAYRRFKSLTEEWLDLALLIAQDEFEKTKKDIKKKF